MATRLKEVDAVMVGMGWTGSILARELTKAGLTVIGLERGEDLSPRENFALPAIRDELRYSYRLELIQDPALETVTFRHRPSELALPMRRFGSFLPGNSVGGAANHWGGQHWRYLPSDHATRSHIVERYGANAIPDDMTIQDWAMSYDELEPYYDKFDKLCGVSGKAGNLRGQKIEGGNVFEGSRSNDYPDAAADHDRIRTDVRQGREGTRLSPVSAAGKQRKPALHQQRRPHPRRMPVLRLL